MPGTLVGLQQHSDIDSLTAFDSSNGIERIPAAENGVTPKRPASSADTVTLPKLSLSLRPLSEARSESDHDVAESVTPL